MLALARMRMAHGGKTLVPIADAATICDVNPHTLKQWVRDGWVTNEPNAKRERARAVIVDLGAVLTVRDNSRLRPEGSPLTYREIAIMRLAATELSAQEIADRTGRECVAVQGSLSRLYAKLGTRGRLGAVVKCLKLKLITLDEIEIVERPNPMNE